MKSLYLIILLPLLIFSCGDDSFKKVEALGNFRLLGILADSPEVDPNGNLSVDVQVLVSDIEGGGRTIQGTVQTCIDPGISFGAQVSCDHDPTSFQKIMTLILKTTQVLETTIFILVSQIFSQ